MLEHMSSRELAEWMAYEQITGPLDERYRMDVAAGTVAATVANGNGAKLRVRDFLHEWFKRKKTPEEIWRDVMRLNTQFGGEVNGDTG